MNNLNALFHKYITDECTLAEIRELMQSFGEAADEDALKLLIAAELKKENQITGDEEVLHTHILKLYTGLKPKLRPEVAVKKVNRIGVYMKYAAAILVVVSLGLYLKLNHFRQQANLMAVHQSKDRAPGGNKALLTLGDGTQISLTDAKNGELAIQSGIKINKTKNGQLVYEVPEVSNAQAMVFNTISTPNGGQYQVSLSDGTRVWLNAGSSLKYPTSFSGGKRRVTMQGEAYFEVAKDKTRPFIVQSNEQEVEVLGTHFNINSYKEEGTIKTTLLEGAIKVSGPGRTGEILKPGQQSVLAPDGIKVYTVDPELAIDWKNGNFYFANENIQSIMRKLSRWYDVEVIYKGPVPQIDFGGEISRSKKLSEILKLLETTGAIHFTVEGRRVMVMR